MTFVNIDVHTITHTCPANTEPHTVDIRRTIVQTIDGGPCRQPTVIHCGELTTTIDCRRCLSSDQQCPACRVTVIERTLTTTHLGRHGPQHPTDTGTAA